jgi:hypothetical protein
MSGNFFYAYQSDVSPPHPSDETHLLKSVMLHKCWALVLYFLYIYLMKIVLKLEILNNEDLLFCLALMKLPTVAKISCRKRFNETS